MGGVVVVGALRVERWELETSFGFVHRLRCCRPIVSSTSLCLLLWSHISRCYYYSPTIYYSGYWVGVVFLVLVELAAGLLSLHGCFLSSSW